jgi:hypothetical protein
MKVTNDMLYRAVKEAVKQGLLPKYAHEERYLKNYEGMKKVLETALGED